MNDKLSLTSREKEILTLLRDGLMQKEIAQQLHIEVQTIKNYINQIMIKLNTKNTTHSVITAIRQGYINL